MDLKSLLLTSCLAVCLSGCLHPSGKRYLDNEQYGQGIRVFEEVLQKNPNDPGANYYIGRFYLAQEKPERALPFLSRAVEIEPKEAGYHFWLGVAYWAVMDFENERLSYLRALAVDKDHVPARLYLAHNLLDNGVWKAARAEYDSVLELDPYNPEALYNRGLALKELDRPSEEITAWKGYLKHYPDGRWALRAVDHLNTLGDFSYRNFTIGYRRVTLEHIAFASGSARLPSNGEPSLQVLGNILRINQRIELEIVGYKNGDPVLARARAKAVKDYLLENFSAIRSSRLKYRGEGRAERIETGNRAYLLDDSISFITTKQ